MIKHYTTRFSFQYNHFLERTSCHNRPLHLLTSSVPKEKRVPLKKYIFSQIFYKIKIPIINGPLWISNLIKHIKDMQNVNWLGLRIAVSTCRAFKYTTCNNSQRRNSHICQSGGREKEKRSYLPLCCNINSGILYLVCMVVNNIAQLINSVIENTDLFFVSMICALLTMSSP